MVNWRFNVSDGMAVRYDRIVNVGVSETNYFAIIESDAPMISSPDAGLGPFRIDQMDWQAIRRIFWGAGTEKFPNFPLQFGRDDFVGIQVQHPFMVALFFCESFLSTKTKPRLGNYARMRTLGNCDGCVGAAAVDDHDFINPRFNRLNCSCDAIGLVLSDDEARYRQSGHNTCNPLTR